MTIILGIDPGLVTTGYGVIKQTNNTITPVAYGVIKPDAKAPMAERLRTLNLKLLDIINLYCPDEAAIEETFVNKNPASALKLAMARCVLLMTPALKEIPVYEYGANQIKKTVIGVGHADKNQIMMMVKRLLPKITGKLTPDSADALAVALCHVQHALLRKI